MARENLIASPLKANNQQILKRLSVSETVQIPGPPGKSSYELAVENGFEGTVEEWLEGLKGETGPQGPKGDSGVYIGSTPPDEVKVWINTDGDEVDFEPFTNIEIENLINSIML